VKYPNEALAKVSMKTTEVLARAHSSQDLAGFKVALPQAEKAINAFSADVSRFLAEFTGSAGTVATVLQVTSAVSFAVVGALAAPILVPAAGATGSVVAAGAGVSALQSAANELGNAASGQKVDLWESAKTVAVDTFIGAATAGLGKKIPLGFVEKMAKGVVGAIAKKLPGLSPAQLQPFVVRWLTGTGEETLKSAMGEALTLVGKMAKSGKVPTPEDFDEAVKKVLITAVTGGLLKNIGNFQKKFAMESRDLLEGQVFPEALKAVMKGKNQLPPVMKAKLWSDVWGKISEEVMKAGTAKALENAKDSDEALLAAAAKAAVMRDPRLRKLMEAEIEKSMKKLKIAA
jgi:hypothetical protein